MTFKVGKTYQSAVKGRKYHVTMKFRVQDTDCLLVYLVRPTTLFGRTSAYRPSMIEDSGKTATVLIPYGFTTIYAEEEE